MSPIAHFSAPLRAESYTATVLRRPVLALALLVAPVASGAQGTVQARDPRRPAPLDPPPECELWRGHIAGNDPTAEATLQLCTDGDNVHGVFLWSSLESGWDRRRFTGQWLEARQRLVLNDTVMMENHPANGWRLCLADRYDLRRVNDGELTGEFWSNACNDHGSLRITRVGPTTAPDAAPSPALTTSSPPRATTPTPRRVLGCTATPTGHTSGSALAGGLLALAALSRCRGSTARR